MTRLAWIVAAATSAVACGDNGKLGNVVTGSTDFGLTDCGTTGDPHVVVVANSGGATFTFTTSLGSGSSSIYTVSPPSGVLLPNNEVELTIYTKAIPAVSATTANLYGDTLTVTTSLASDKPHVIPITQTAHGAVLQLSTSTLSFPSATIGAAAQTMPLTITNAGNSDTTVTVPTGVSFTLSPTGTQTIAAGSALSTTVAYTPLAVGAISESLALTATGPQCGAPATLTATAMGTLTGTAKVVAMSTARGRPKTGINTLCAIVSSGFVACTGDNTFGQRGAGQGAVPTSTDFNIVLTAAGPPLDQVTQLEGGRNRFCALRQTGDAWCWGDVVGIGLQTTRGGGDAVQTTPAAIEVAGLGNLSVAVNYGFTCLVNSSNAVSCTAPASSSSGDSPQQVGAWSATNATAVSTNAEGGLALTNTGTVLSFGGNSSGERGLSSGVAPAANSPASSIDGLSNIIQVSAGGINARRAHHHGCAVDNAGSAWCWGSNRHGELGNGSTDTANNATPGQVLTAVDTPLTGVTQVSASQAHSCAVNGGTVFCWGRGTEGQLGLPPCGGSVTTSCANENNGFAQQVPGLTTATSVVARAMGACAVTSTGGVTCWGNVPGTPGSTPTVIAAFGP
jgi:alpha-tubulin suppressor-like RCC1 family protein